jgi:IclR family pca regulon transcriptional regulator
MTKTLSLKSNPRKVPNGGRRSSVPPAEAAQDSTMSSTGIGGLMNGDRAFMMSLARGLAVIRAFTDEVRPISTSNISRKTGLSRAAVRRCLHTLSKLGLADCEDGTHFFLLPRILELGNSYLSSKPLTKVVQPALEEVGHALSEFCSIGVLDDLHVICVARANVARIAPDWPVDVGSRMPAHRTTSGRVLLADFTSAELESFLVRVQLIRDETQAGANIEQLREELAAVRRNGYALSDSEAAGDVRTIAVPLKNTNGKAVAALDIAVPSKRATLRQLQTRFLPSLRAAALRMCPLLG